MSSSCLTTLKQSLSGPAPTEIPLATIRNFLTVGELVDRLTILDNKTRIADEETCVAIQKQMADICELIGWSISDKPGQVDELCRLAAQLHASNQLQWEFENKVRSENPAQAGFWAQKARNQNNRRVELKNQINSLFGQDSEYKKYS